MTQSFGRVAKGCAWLLYSHLWRPNTASHASMCSNGRTGKVIRDVIDLAEGQARQKHDFKTTGAMMPCTIFRLSLRSTTNVGYVRVVWDNKPYRMLKHQPSIELSRIVLQAALRVRGANQQRYAALIVLLPDNSEA